MSFAALPRELQLRILRYATQPPHGSLGQAPTLARVSRVTYSIITELLFKHIRLTNVTMLRRIHAALEANPALGERVQSIHIGADNALSFHGWPLQVDRDTHIDDTPTLYLETTLPASQLPRWVKPGSVFSIEGIEVDDCQHCAVSRAIGAATSDLDVDPGKRGWSKGAAARRIGVRAWALRLWELQAALDLYLMDMRRREDEGAYDVEDWTSPKPETSGASALQVECETGLCGHYPILELKKHSIRGSWSAGKYLYLSEEDLWRHLSRQSGPAQHFDHLIIFSRSRASDLSMGKWEWSSLREDLKGPHQAWYNEEREEEDDDNSSAASDEADWSIEEPTSNYSDATVGKGEELLALTREVLARTPRVTNLSLSSFFHKALSGYQLADSLVALTLAPIVRWWLHVLLPFSPNHEMEQNSRKGTFDVDTDSDGAWKNDDGEATMSRLVSLRICGSITSRDARKIASQLPNLREMFLEIVGEYGSQ